MNNNRSIRTLLYLTNGLTVIYLLWRLFFTLPFDAGVISMILGISLLIVEAFGLIESLIHFHNIGKSKKYPVPKIRDNEFPDVDVFIATYNEEEDLLYKTVNSCRRMKYPDPSKVHIYLCDDNRRKNIRELAERMGVGYFDRPDNKGAKAGNLNNALSKTSSPYVVTFDADMIPKSDFLLKTIPYFVEAENLNRNLPEDKKINLGLLQTPQAFYNPDLFQFNLFSEKRIPNEQDYFYKDIQEARTQSNSVIYGGSNTVLSRKALNAIGGFYTKAITEDFATGLLMEQQGFVSLGTSEQLASGLSPNSLDQLIQQRVRWGRGVINTGKKMGILTSKKLSFEQKLNYWASIWYWFSPFKRLIYIMGPIAFATFGLTVFRCTLEELFVFWMPMALMNSLLMKKMSSNRRTVKWTAIYETIMFPFLLIPILLESFGFSLSKFKVTDKSDTGSKRGENLVYTIPFGILLILSLIGAFNCVVIIFDSNSIAPVIGLYWLVMNAYALVMALFFMVGRDWKRQAERISASNPAVIHDGEMSFHGHLYDISETGVSFICEDPVYMNPHGLTVSFTEGCFSFKFDIKPVHTIALDEGGWKYCFQIEDFNGKYDDYLAVLYDRRPELPEAITRKTGCYEDLRLNIFNRFKGSSLKTRTQVLICLDEKSSEGVAKTSVKVAAFDFESVYIVGAGYSNTIQIKLDDAYIECLFDRKLSNGNSRYFIVNISDIVSDSRRYQKLVEALRNRRLVSANVQDQPAKKRNRVSYFNELDFV